MTGKKAPSTIEDHIKKELARICSNDDQLYDKCHDFDRDMKALIQKVDDHLTKIRGQMPDYDKHDASHSGKCLEHIEKLLGPDGIGKMPFLEAELLLLCCHFHDTGMAVPDWCFDLLKKVEAEDFVWHKSRSEVLTALHAPDKAWAPAKTHNEVKDLFLIPPKESDFYEWLADEIWNYEVYRQGLEAWDRTEERDKWVCETREEYLRSTHGKRSGEYAKSIGNKWSSLNKYAAIQKKLGQEVGMICAAHTQPIDAVWSLPSREFVKPSLSDEALTYNPQFLAMLLRLGDVLDFSEDRASRTLYAESNPMNRISDKHWQVKNLTGLAVEIKPHGRKNKRISFMGSFDKPEHYYFIHDYLNWADAELKNYARFLSNMEKNETPPTRYDLLLPEKVDRSSLDALEFTPDRDLRFTLEQRRIIELLMGTRLYSDRFTCLRELYQNALDASRCMRAENKSKGVHGPLPIVFGLETDEATGRTFLYCRDQGIGMTEETIKRYLLRVGNSYYCSAEFRRDNASWGNAVSPISEFGIGLLSCFMIGDRIEVLTRHFSSRPGDPALWVCIDSEEGYGYYKEPSRTLRDRLGDHGTEIRVFLKEDCLEQLGNTLPESQEDAMDRIYLTRINILPAPTHPISAPLSLEEIDYYKTIYDSDPTLWYRLQTMICVPELDFPVSVRSGDEEYQLQMIQTRYPLEDRFDQIHEYSGAPDRHKYDQIQEACSRGKVVPVDYTDEETGSEARTWLYLPVSDTVRLPSDLLSPLGPTFCVDGLTIELDWGLRFSKGICWNWKGSGKPELSVSRESISRLPPVFDAAYGRVMSGLYQNVCNAIDHHFERYSDANTAQVRSFLLQEIWDRMVGSRYCSVLLEKLSAGPYRDHKESGIPMRALLDEPCSFSLVPADLRYNRFSSTPLSYLAPAVLMKASRICLEKDTVRVETDGNPLSAKWPEDHKASLVYKADPGSSSWGVWDAESDLLPFVSPALFQTLLGEALGSGFGNQAELPDIVSNDALLDNSRSVFFQAYDLKEVLQQLQDKGWAVVNSIDNDFSVDVSKGALLFLVRISPAPETDDTEQAIRIHSNIPAYVQGAREGWTVLLFPSFLAEQAYNYILAPGVVNRFKMAKHIPSEIVEEAKRSGHPLRFTDGTLAFPEA